MKWSESTYIDNYWIVEQQKTSYWRQITRIQIHSSKPFSTKRSKEKEEWIADNIHGFASLQTDAISQTLPVYSDMQKRTRFAFCDKYMNNYTLYWTNIRQYKKKKTIFSIWREIIQRWEQLSCNQKIQIRFPASQYETPFLNLPIEYIHFLSSANGIRISPLATESIWLNSCRSQIWIKKGRFTNRNLLVIKTSKCS
jgi:hypothetical protein